MTLFKFYLLQKIEKETTIISEESGDLLIDNVYVVVLPCKDVVRIREGDSTLFESQKASILHSPDGIFRYNCVRFFCSFAANCVTSCSF